jgi:hypothetical protein
VPKFGKRDGAPIADSRGALLNQEEREPQDGKTDCSKPSTGLIRGRFGFLRGFKIGVKFGKKFRIRQRGHNP